MSKQHSETLAYLEREARRFAASYPPSSDGRNTFGMFADKIASQAHSAADPLDDLVSSDPTKIRYALEDAKDEADLWHKQALKAANQIGWIEAELKRAKQVQASLLDALQLVWDTYGMDPSVDSSIWQTVKAALALGTPASEGEEL